MSDETRELLLEIAKKIKAEGDAYYASCSNDDSEVNDIERIARSAGFDRSAIIVLEHIK